MKLCEVNEYLGHIAERMMLPGRMVLGGHRQYETPAVRINMYKDDFLVTDISNKQPGETVGRFLVYNLSYADDPEISKHLDKFLSRAKKSSSYRDVLSMAKGLVSTTEKIARKREGGDPDGWVEPLKLRITKFKNPKAK